jgi:CHAD domain-containing protein
MTLPTPVRLYPDSAAILERSRGVFFAQWEELLRLRSAVIKTADRDDIHDLRVASRRFRAALELFYPFLPKGAKTELRKNVRNLTRTLGGLRNIDEALLFFQSRAHSDSSGHSSDSKLLRALAALRSGELKRIAKALKAFDHRHFDQVVRGMIAGLNEDSITSRNSFSLLAYFSEVSIRQYLPIHHLLSDATTSGQRTSRHALRIAIKKWRYFFELSAPILERDYSSILELLKEYQSILGRLNDIVEFEALIRNLKRPKAEREFAGVELLTEEALLLEKLAALIDQKPLTYTFLI